MLQAFNIRLQKMTILVWLCSNKDYRWQGLRQLLTKDRLT